MKTLVVKLLLILVISISIKLPFVLLYPMDEVSYRKRELSKREYDTVLIGSSRTQFGVQPAYFDSLAGDKIKSYNFGISAGILPHTIEWCEDLIRRKPSLRDVIFELTGSGAMARGYVEPWVEFHLQDYWKALRTYSFQQSSVYHDYLALGFLKPHLSPTIFFDNNRPLDSLQVEYALPPAETSLDEIHRARARNLAVATGDQKVIAEPDSALWQRLSGLIALADSAGVRIRFFIPPRLETDTELETVKRVWHKLDEKHRLRVDHSEAELYSIENSYDKFHLNHKGAMRFTENLAAVFFP